MGVFSELSAAIMWPQEQKHHNYIDKRIMPWLDLHFPADSSFYGRVFLGYHRKDGNGIYNLTRRNIDELAPFIPEMHISRNVDYYITANSMCGVRRVTEDVFGLHNIVIDIDCHEDIPNSADLTAALIWRCARDLWGTGECPEPNSVVFSGRGVQLWWALEPASVKIQYWYKRMQAWLMDALQGVLDDNPEELGDLSIDRSASIRLAGLFRLPLTYNTKTGRKGRMQILHSERYKLQDMLETYVPREYNPHLSKSQEKAPWTVVEGKQEQKIYQPYVPLALRDSEVLQGGSSAMAARVQQLVRLRALRKAGIGDEMRDRFCFAVYCALLADHDQTEAWERLLAFNDGFKEPLPLDKLRQAMSTASVRQYRLTNKWVITELEINETEQDAIGLHPNAGDSTKTKTKNYTRDLIRRTVREDRDNKILAMFADGSSKSQIARTLDVSWNTVAKVISAEEARRSSQIAEQEAEEAEIMEAMEQVAVGAEGQKIAKMPGGANSSKMVHNNIASYSHSGLSVSSRGRQRGRPPGSDPPS